MIIIALTDIHGSLRYLPGISHDLASADLVLIAGDITHFGNYNDAKNIIDELRIYNSNILAVCGNCDPLPVDKYLRDEQINLSCNCVDQDGITFVGAAGSLPCPAHTPNESSEDEFADCLGHVKAKISSAQSTVFVSHQPAQNTVVDTVGGRHTGSAAIRAFIEDCQPLLVVSGHIHEAVGIDRIGKTILINPGPLRQGSYAFIEINNGKVETTDLRTAE